MERPEHTNESSNNRTNGPKNGRTNDHFASPSLEERYNNCAEQSVCVCVCVCQRVRTRSRSTCPHGGQMDPSTSCCCCL